ncbi:uncharacterized protein [Triticum aestivum]|uniref:uncharacterized protein n=1 Tax=Triticum aestivum TaxID=4565 RepID=UPI0008447713|nr:uncharacterized protein LOC123166319 [Triticum aestivum]
MLPACSLPGLTAKSGVGTWKEEFFFSESSAPWPCPVEWGEPSRSSAMDPALTVEEKAVAEILMCARGSSLIDLTTYLSNRNLVAAKIIGAPSPPPTPQAQVEDIQAEQAATAAASRASTGKVTVKGEPDCKVPPCAPSLGKKRKLEEGRGVDGGSSALDLSCPPGFSAPWKSPPVTGKDGDRKAARLLLQGTVTPSRERELAASKPADVVASSYVSLLQAANEVSFSLGHALELEEKLRAREREAGGAAGGGRAAGGAARGEGRAGGAGVEQGARARSGGARAAGARARHGGHEASRASAPPRPRPGGAHRAAPCFPVGVAASTARRSKCMSKISFLWSGCCYLHFALPFSRAICI